MMMKRRGYSKKINYKVIDDLYVPSRSGSASLVGTPGSAGKPALSSPSAEPANIAEGDAAEAEGEGAAAAAEGGVADEAENPDDYYEDENEETLEDIVQELQEEGELEDEYEGEEYE